MGPRRSEEFRKVSDAELSLLELLWREGPCSPQRLQERLAEEGTSRAYTTVQTLLHRLHDKGYVDRERDGQAQTYSPTVDRDEVLAEHALDLAERLCEGEATPLLLSLVRSKKLRARDVEALREVLDEVAPPRRKRRR